MRTIGIGLIVAAAAGAALPAVAGTFRVPEGCTAFATVQLRNCQISQHYRCAGDPAGHQWAVMLDGEGPYFASRIDAETRWIESIDLYTGETDRIGDEVDPASFSTLIETGTDTFDFKTDSTTGEVRRYVGFDKLTGATAVIDGVPLERTEFDLSAYAEDGTFLWRRVGRQFIHRDWRIFLSDTEDFENGFGDRDRVVDTPVDFAFPGDKDFLSDQPKYDCDVVTAEVRP